MVCSCGGRLVHTFVVALFVAFGSLPAVAEPEDAIEHARRLDGEHHRDQAIQVLKDRLAASPTDGDARVVLGGMLSWEGRYDEARETLQPLMQATPPRSDAVRVMINVEVWSEHADRAEPLIRTALETAPEDDELHLLLARALRDQRRFAEAQVETEGILKRAPKNGAALALLEALKEEQRWWAISGSFSHDWFNDGRADWNEASVSVKRRTPIGAVLARLSYANRFGYNDEQAELEFYPSFRPGTYGYIELGYAPFHQVYPLFRWSADLYQSLGAGFEASVGWRQLYFPSAVNIGALTLGKYWSDWWFYLRGFIVPGTADSPGLSGSIHLGARWYFDDAHAYVGARYARGGSTSEALSGQIRSAFDLNLLSADTVSIEYDQSFRTGWGANARVSVSREQRSSRKDLYQTDLTVGATYRF